MAKYSNTVEYQIRTTLDSSGIAKLKAELATLQQTLISNNAKGIIPEGAFKQTLSDIKQVETALSKAFNGKLGMLDLKKFNSELTAGGRTLNDYYKSFSNLGSQGTRAFGQMYGQLTKIDTGMKQVSSTTDKIANTFGNTFRWGIIASMFSGIMNTFHESVQYVKDLDNSLTQIMMVSGIARENMNQFAVQANEAAKMLGGTTVQMTEATKVFIQQGFDLQQSTQLGEYAVHLANVSEQDSATASDEITAYMNAFRIPLEDLGNAISKWAAVANATAVDVEELSIASQKAASVAATVGVDMDQFAGHIAAIESVTREAPENIGNGLKTIYSRIADVSLGETLEDGVNLGSFAKALEKVGVSVLDQAGNLRDTGVILEDLMGVWQDLDQTQRAAVAKTVAGRFQLARFEALMNRADIYENAANISRAETGTDTYDRMQETYKNSMEGRLNTLTATIEGIFVKAFNTDDFYGLIDAAQALADTFDNLIQAIGGGDAALTALGAVLTKVFSKNIAQGIGNSFLNRETNQLARSNMSVAISNARQTAAQGGVGLDSKYLNDMTSNIANVQKNMGSFSQEQLDVFNEKAQKHIQIMTEAAIAEKEFTTSLEAAETLIRSAEIPLSENTSLHERYAEVLRRVAEAEADGVPFVAAEDEMYKALMTDIEKLNRGLVNLSQGFEKITKTEQMTNEQVQSLQKNAKMLNLAVKELAESESLSNERKQQLKRTSKVLSQIEQGEIKNKTQLSKAINKASLEAKDFYSSLGLLAKEGVDVSSIVKKMGVDFQQLSSYAAVSSQEMRGAAEAASAQNFANGIANLASGVMSVVFAFQSIQGAIDAINNEDLDPFEKLEQSLMGFAMAASMVVPQAIRGGKAIADWGKLTIQTGKATQALQASLFLEADSLKRNAAGTIVMNAAKKEGITVSGNSQKAMAQELMKRQGLTNQQKRAIITVLGLTEAEAAEAGIAPVAASGTRVFSAAVKDLAASIWEALAPMLPFIAAAAAIAAVIGAVILTVKNAHDQYYRFDIALDKAKESLTRANEELDVARDRVEALNESLEKVNNIDDTFANLNRGTVEWNQALLEANQNVLDLLETYPELSKYIEHGEYGELTISEEGQDFLRDKTQAQLEGAQVNVAHAQSGVFEAERDKYMMDFIHDNAQFLENQNTKVYATGPYSPGISITDDAAMLSATEEIVDAWRQSDGNITTFRSTLESLGYTAEQIDAIVGENGDAIKALTNSIDENTLKQDAAAQAYAAQVMSDNETYQKMGSNAQHMVDMEVARLINDEDTRKTYSDAFRAEYADVDAAAKWAQEQGIFGQGSKYENGKWYDAENNEIERLNSLTKDQLYQEIEDAHIGYAIADSIQKDSDKIVQPIFNAFTNAEIAGGKGFASIFAGKDENGQGQFDTSAMTNLSPEDLENIDFSSMSSEDWQQLGFNSAADFVQSFNEYYKQNPIEVKPEIPSDTSMDFGEEEISSLLEDTSMSENAFNRMSQSMYENEDGYFQQRKEQLEEEIQAQQEVREAQWDASKSLEEQNEAYQNATEQMEDYQKELSGLEKQSRDTAAMNLRTNRGIMNLVNSYEDLAYQMEVAEEGSADYYEALGQLDEMVSDIVNIDTGTLSDDFYKNADAMQAMQDLANGDANAIDRLRDLASQDIIQNMEIKTVDAENGTQISAESMRSKLMDLRNLVQQDLDAGQLNLQVGTNVDLQNYVAQLQSMVDMGAITAEQATAALSSMGFEGEVQTKMGTHKVPVTHYFMEVNEYGKNPDGTSNNVPVDYTIRQNTTYETVTEEYPQLVGAHYTGSGLQVAQPSSLGGGSIGGAKSSGGGGGGKGGSGGSGSGGSVYKKDKQDREKDRYEKVNTALEKIDSSLANITMDQDRLIGTRAIDNLEKETDLLKEQIPWYEKKLEIQKEEARELRDQLAADFGATFSDSGQLQNYSEIYDQLTDEYEKARQKWDGRTLSDEEKETADKELSAIEERQKIFDKIYARYDTLYSKDIPDTEKALKEIQDRLEDIAEEAFRARREAAQMLNDMRETARDTEQTFQNLFGEHPKINFDLSMKNIDEIIGGPELEANLAKYITDYENKLSQATDKNMKQYYQSQIDALKQVQANGGNGLLAFNENRLAEVMRMWDEWQKTGSYTIEGQTSTNEQALLDLMKEAVEDGNDLMSNLSSAISDAMDNMEALGEIMDAEIENQLSGMDAINDKIEHQQNMMELIYGEQASAAQVQLLNRQAEVEENRIGILEKQLDIQKQATATAKEMYEADLAAHGGDAAKANQDLLEKYLDALEQERDIDNQILETREKIAESYRDAKEAANDLAVDQWLEQFQGQLTDNGPFVPLEYMADQWERIQENEELYLDDLNRAYEIQKLSNRYQQMLNDATDPKIQQQITDQMREQLAYLNEKTNLSKYDVDYANAQLEILQKTIALEDARAAKNQMKLRRDSQGNYQYVYAADQNQTAEAENDLLDASMNAYNMSKEQQADVQDSYIRKVQDMADALRKAANDATLDEEQIAAITQDIIDKGHEYLEAMGEQLNTSQQNMISSFIDAAFQLQEEYASGVRNIAEELKEDTSRGLDDVDDRFDTSVNNWVDGEATIREQSNKTRENIVDNVHRFTDAITDANLAVVEPLGEIQSGVDGIDDSIVKMKDDMSDLYNVLDQQKGAFADAGADIAALQKELTDANSALSKYATDLQAANDRIQELTTANEGLTARLNGGGSGSGGGSGAGGSGSGSSPKASEIKPGNKYKYIGGLYYHDSYGGKPTGNRGPGGTVTVAYTNFGAPYPIAVESDDSAYGWLKEDQLVKLKSGGYTGEWGADGRMAMLHEKELVLNSTDTQNILAAVDAVRMITEQLKGSAFINNIGSSIGKAAQNNIQGNSIEQRVEITANFPNVNSAEEIERALLNISDRSYQYAYNKNDIPW